MSIANGISSNKIFHYNTVNFSHFVSISRWVKIWNLDYKFHFFTWKDIYCYIPSFLLDIFSMLLPKLRLSRLHSFTVSESLRIIQYSSCVLFTINENNSSRCVPYLILWIVADCALSKSLALESHCSRCSMIMLVPLLSHLNIDTHNIDHIFYM